MGTKRTNTIRFALHRTFVGFSIAFLLAGIPSLLARKGAPAGQSNGVTIPEGTTIEVRMMDELNTGTNRVGDRFKASLTRDLNVGGRQIARKDSLVGGKVVELVSSGE
jgi:hypothetical protein